MVDRGGGRERCLEDVNAFQITCRRPDVEKGDVAAILVGHEHEVFVLVMWVLHDFKSAGSVSFEPTNICAKILHARELSVGVQLETNNAIVTTSGGVNDGRIRRVHVHIRTFSTELCFFAVG